MLAVCALPIPLLLQKTKAAKGRAFKIELSKVSGSALAAEICAGPHNRLLRRQHCSSLCLQSEGHEHVANIASALAHDFVGFLAVFVRRNSRPPHFASKVSYNAAPHSLPQEIRQFVVPSATSFVPPSECLLRFTTNVPLILKSIIKH